MISSQRVEAEIRSQSLKILAEQADEGEFVLPHYQRYSLVNLANTVLARFGLPTCHPPLPEELLPSKGEVRKIVLLLIDSLGYLQLHSFLERNQDSFFNKLIAQGNLVPLSSVFPSTTTTALATLHTALTPQEHGILGYRLFLKEFGVIANMIRLSPINDPVDDRLFRMGLRPRSFLGCTTIHDRLKGAGISSYLLIRRIYARSGLSKMLSPASSKIVPFANSSDMSVSLRKLLQGGAERAFIFAYWDALDEISHVYGPESEEWDAELLSLGYVLERSCLGDLKAPFLKDTLLLIASDHGHLRVLPKREVINLSRYPTLKSALALPPTGEYRASYLYAKPGMLNELEEGLLKRFADRLVVLRSSEALAGGLFGCGTLKAETPDRIGDLVVIPKGPQALRWPYDEFKLLGRHGGLSEDEMLVPLIAF
jgi:predicted AlkP superfamily pyrophosphatase or phosphodiesterase